VTVTTFDSGMVIEYHASGTRRRDSLGWQPRLRWVFDVDDLHMCWHGVGATSGSWWFEVEL
jgi:hypothetical protein